MLSPILLAWCGLMTICFLLIRHENYVAWFLSPETKVAFIITVEWPALEALSGRFDDFVMGVLPQSGGRGE